jgi:hypothetical protein
LYCLAEHDLALPDSDALQADPGGLGENGFYLASISSDQNEGEGKHKQKDLQRP